MEGGKPVNSVFDLFIYYFPYIDSRSHWLSSKCVCSNSLCQGRSNYETLVSTHARKTRVVNRGLCSTKCHHSWQCPFNQFYRSRWDLSLTVISGTYYSLVDAVERAAGLTLFSDEVKQGSKHICQSTKCEVIVRRFGDAQKKEKAIATPK